ncbi:LysR family transcriptional regulator [Paracoccus luteus]|uniref:LysR family transcriptional regulator n=1 Tax=Paracoccus luteus TaxID=2508543 RepID=UPI00106F2380|nr:LysR family transcriptional regulator [Paracoccus luteus]
MNDTAFPTLRQMEVFRAIAVSHSFSVAAERLGVSQPSLSALVRKMEAALQLELFHRTTRRVELTEAGQLFLDRAAPCLAAAAALREDMNGFRVWQSGVVRVAAPPLLASAVLPRVIREFAVAAPGVQLEISDAGTADIIETVRSGHASFGIGTFPDDLPDLSSTVIMRDEAMLFCHRDHPAAAHRELGWADIVTLPQITLGQDSGLRTMVERGFAQAGHPLQPAFQVNQISTVLGMVAQNVGVAVLPAYARALIGHGPLVGVRLLAPVIVRNISLLHVSGRRMPPAVQTFADIIRRTIHERPSQDQCE